MLTISALIVLGAFVTAIAEAMGKCPGWVPVILLCLFAALMVFPK